MLCRSVSTRLVFAAVTLASAGAVAEPNPSNDPSPSPVAGSGLAIPTPAEQSTTPFPKISGVIYLERCQGGCIVTGTGQGGSNDARAMLSSIPKTLGANMIAEYRNGAGDSGAAADIEWAALVK